MFQTIAAAAPLPLRFEHCSSPTAGAGGTQKSGWEVQVLGDLLIELIWFNGKSLDWSQMRRCWIKFPKRGIRRTCNKDSGLGYKMPYQNHTNIYHRTTILIPLRSSQELYPIPVPCHRPPCLAFAKGFQFTELDLPGVICIKLEEGLQISSRMYRMSYVMLKQKCIPIFPWCEQYGRFSSSPKYCLTWNHILKFQSCGSCHQTVGSSCQAGLQDLHNASSSGRTDFLVAFTQALAYALWHHICVIFLRQTSLSRSVR